jgi:mannose-6-phosphate isomerase-like protein (cupin superfamily)
VWSNSGIKALSASCRVPAHRHAWLEAYYMLYGRMTAHVDDHTYELAPGSSLTVPPQTTRTFVPVDPSAKFLVFTLTDAMGKFFTDLHRTVPTGQPLQDVVPLLLEVTERHGVTFAAPVMS